MNYMQENAGNNERGAEKQAPTFTKDDNENRRGEATDGEQPRDEELDEYSKEFWEDEYGYGDMDAAEERYRFMLAYAPIL